MRQKEEGRFEHLLSENLIIRLSDEKAEYTVLE